MEIDVNIKAHDLLWRSMSLGAKKAYRDSYGPTRDELVEQEVRRLIEGGYAMKTGVEIELTPGGEELYKKMTSICKKSE